MDEKTITNVTCKCGKTLILLKPFFSVNYVCLFCKTLTENSYYASNRREKQNSISIVSYGYRPGYCECGNINTEVIWGNFVLCGICHSAIGIKRYVNLGFLSLATCFPPIWYKFYNLNPVQVFIGFTNKIYALIRNRSACLRNRSCVKLKGK